MKKSFLQHVFAVLTLALCLVSCNSDNDNYPKNYVGFEHSTKSVTCDKSKAMEDIQIKIIAVEKEKEDRVLKLSISNQALPGKTPIFQLTEKQVTIKAENKSVTTTIKIFPKEMLMNKQYLQLVCTPQWKGGEPSKITIQLIAK